MFDSNINTNEQPLKPNPADFNTGESNIGAVPNKEGINLQNSATGGEDILNTNPPKSEYLSPQPEVVPMQPEKREEPATPEVSENNGIDYILKILPELGELLKALRGQENNPKLRQLHESMDGEYQDFFKVLILYLQQQKALLESNSANNPNSKEPAPEEQIAA